MKRKRVQGSRKDAIHDAPKQGMVEGIVRKCSKKFSREEIEYLIHKRNVFVIEGMRDTQISKKIALKMQRTVGSVYQKIRELVRNGKLERNGNNQKQNNFTQEETEYLIQRRKELILEGMKDWQIARKVAKEMKISMNTIIGKIRHMVRKGKLEKNLNRQEQKGFTDREINFIIRRRKELALEGINDWQIARKVAAETGRTVGSVEVKITVLVENQSLAKNANKQEQRDFTQKDIDFIILRRKELALEGMKDQQIARKVAVEMKRKMRSVKKKIFQLVRIGEMEKNVNKQEAEIFKQEDIDFIMRRREDLTREGMNDGQIARKVAPEIGRNVGTTREKIRKLAIEGKLERNENKKDKKCYSLEDIDFIIQIRNELAVEGMKDGQIAKIIATQTGRTAGSVVNQIIKLVRKDKLKKNENRQDARPCKFFTRMTDEEIVGFARRVLLDLGIKKRSELISLDVGLYKVLRKRKLLDRVFPESAKKSESELLSQLKDAVELYLGKGEQE